MVNVKSVFLSAKKEAKDLSIVSREDANSVAKNLYMFPAGKKLTHPMTVLYVDWNDSTGINETYNHDSLEYYYRLYCRGVSNICNKHKEVRFVDFQGDGVLIFIPGKGKRYLRIAKEIDEDIRTLIEFINNDPDIGIDDLSAKSAYDDGDVTISKVGRASKNSRKFQNLVFVGSLVSSVVKSAK